MQFVAASAEYVPTAHATHAVDAFASRSAVPARHGMQLVWASDTAARPAAHAIHAVAGLESRSAKPVLQFVHRVDPAAAYVPAAHTAPDTFPSHAVDASESWSTYPAAHCTHTVDPAAA